MKNPRSLLPALFLILTSLLPLSAFEADALKHDIRFFSDPAATVLNADVGMEDVSRFKSPLMRQVAERLLKGQGHPEYVVADFPAIPSPAALSRELKLGKGFSKVQNITGMYLEKGKHAVLVGATHGHKVTLILPNWMRKPPEGIKPTKDPNGWGLKKQIIELKEGLNVVEVETSTNAYIGYEDDHPEKMPDIRVHFLTGTVNGYFDLSRHDNEDFNRLLDNAVSPIMDAVGRYVQAAYPVEMFQLHTRGRGVELMENYDRILRLHYKQLGLLKYREPPMNRILSRVNYNYYMFRDGDGMAYLGTERVMGMVLNPDRVVQGDPNWGFSHEAGHVMQMRQITWGGMTEVSVNIFTLHAQRQLGIPCRLKRQKNYEKARKSIIESDPKISFLDDPDLFNRVVPFWQLHLYFTQNGHPDFYADVMEEMRRRPSQGKGDESINNQFQFIEIVCDVTRTDLTEFFEQWGFFQTGDISVNDYRAYTFNVTPEQVAKVKARIAAKGYTKPKLDLTRVTSDYKAEAKVEPGNAGAGGRKPLSAILQARKQKGS